MHFMCSFSLYSILRTYTFDGSRFCLFFFSLLLCSLFELKLRLHFLNNNNEVIKRGCEKKHSQPVLIRTENSSNVSSMYTQIFSNFKKWLNRTSILYAVTLFHQTRERERERRNIHTWQTISNNSNMGEKKKMEQN